MSKTFHAVQTALMFCAATGITMLVSNMLASDTIDIYTHMGVVASAAVGAAVLVGICTRAAWHMFAASELLEDLSFFSIRVKNVWNGDASMSMAEAVYEAGMSLWTRVLTPVFCFGYVVLVVTTADQSMAISAVGTVMLALGLTAMVCCVSICVGIIVTTLLGVVIGMLMWPRTLYLEVFASR